MAGAFAVIVIIELEAGQAELFIALVEANASASLDEPGCHRFDVVVSPERQVYLYELYEGPAAFQAHLDTAHFISFDAVTRPMVKSKQVLTGMIVGGETGGT